MSTITNLELQNKFNTATENNANRNLLIENEIREIENYVNYIPAYTSPFRKKAIPLTINKSPKIFDFGNTYIDRKIFNESFYEYLNSGKPITIERLHNDNDEMYRIKQNSANQSIETFKYYEWLKIQLSIPQKAQKKSSLSHKQKLLALHYLGLDTSKYDNTKIAKILSEILELSEDNTRQYLSYLSAGKNDVRTKTNLEKVNQLFENQEITDISNTIKKDLEKL